MRASFLAYCLLILCSIPSHAEVTIQYLGNELVYPKNPKLTTVLASLVQGRDFYWSQAALYDLSAPEENKLKREAIQLLNAVQANTGIKTHKWAALESVKQQISAWKVADRKDLVIDFDLIRISSTHNRRLDDGNYFLWLPFRAVTITVFGAIEQEIEIPHRGATHVKHYLEQVKLSEYADTAYVYVILPDGTYKKVSLGVHSLEHVEVSPGGSIYIPIKELPFLSTNEELNERIAALAGSRLP